MHKQLRRQCLLCCIALLSCCLLGGCVSINKKFEVISPLEQSSQAIKATPTDFFVDFGADVHAWERVSVFFDEFSPKFEIESDGSTIPQMKINSAPLPENRYIYRVSKRPARGGYRYNVACDSNLLASPPPERQNARQNAQNLARFIRDGQLERSLLAR
ncbi:MAG: hypothetical protein K1X83_02185 [Oligoflexia bacterium]|nr:hypothetical protein [Oligoflexia bacterium]